jgi:hypothetical protein
MKVVRKITYESPDESKLQNQLARSLQPGVHHLATDITIEHLEGPTWEENPAFRQQEREIALEYFVSALRRLALVCPDRIGENVAVAVGNKETVTAKLTWLKD